MIHLLPLPGAPRFDGSMDEVTGSRGRRRPGLCMRPASPHLLVENFGDAPFRADRVDPETVAAMTMAIEAVITATVLAGRGQRPSQRRHGRPRDRCGHRCQIHQGQCADRCHVHRPGADRGQGSRTAPAASRIGPRSGDLGRCHGEACHSPPGLDARSGRHGHRGDEGLPTRSSSPARARARSPTSSGWQGSPLGGPQGHPDRHRVGSDVPGISADCIDFADSVIVGSGVKVDNDASNRVDQLKAAAFVEAAADHGLL